MQAAEKLVNDRTVQAGETLAPSHPPSSLGARPHGHWGPPSRGRYKQFPSRWFLAPQC